MNLMPILFYYISQVIAQLNYDTFVSKDGENNKAVHLRLVLTYLS